MTPETKDYLDKAAENLADARTILAIPLAKVAARSAYYAAFHAAEALLMARTGRIAKTHRGVRSALAELLSDASTDDREILTFLARGYRFKELSDYGVGSAAVITEAEASDLINGASRCLDRARALIGESDMSTSN
ncbi:HEPN domain-containing protein [Methylorubrum salsuginis]|uniref:Uncharacterized protein, contains HEPN domain, UPF0332 family n=1 Tax=Methylorubrum salsuginis TaxID=414703 RepID=A0A1I4I3W9_9HYPH|nr:HEPN domain-containing protein [Methylorubrum salsuginis]SFL48870.1 Uncharacterized protein, contains HEPN domain, UPF0332 family [Methylorubrum salsuginis]